MSIEQMRMAIKKSYPGEKWRRKVEQMSDAQVIAVYHDLLNKKKLA